MSTSACPAARLPEVDRKDLAILALAGTATISNLAAQHNVSRKFVYRAVDKQGKTIDVLLTAKRDMAAAKRFFDKAMRENGVPDKVAMDKSGANKAAIDALNAGRDVPIMVRQVKYLNNIVEQDHRAIKRVTRPMLNFKSFRGAGCVLAGVELMHMIRKGQFKIDGADAMSFADQFYALAAQVRPV